ncbi:MAG: RNA polymerase sigma factor [Planctomycetes bacterium]|nr:RNA polymerase sigma factor [Planctomycetota bacterium]
MDANTSFLQRLTHQREGLTAYCQGLLWSAEDLEDVLQEIMLVAYRKRSETAPESDLRAWMFRIATLTCFNFNRRHARIQHADLSADWVEALEDALDREYTYEEILKDPAALLEKFDDEVARACRELNEKERAILLLKSVGGLSCAEIAKVMEIPLGTAQGLLTRARMKVRERLSERLRSRRHPPLESP